MRKNKKLAAIAVIGLLTTTFTSCVSDVSATEQKVITSTVSSYVDEEELNINEISTNVIEEETKVEENVVESELTKEESTIEDPEDEIEETPVENFQIVIEQCVEATVDLNIRSSSNNGEKLGVLPAGYKLPFTHLCEDGWYEVIYYGKPAYVSSEYVVETTKPTICGNIEKMIYTPEETELIIPDYLSETGNDETVLIPALECFEVYKELDNYYLVETPDYVGYISKENVVELTDTFVVVDISDQRLRLYKDNEIILETPVVTGKPSSPTHQGLFEVYNITHSRYLRGPGYASYVDIMMKFNNNEGLHDAEYHTCNRSHGWRSQDEFGGNTYLTNGSHGCVNMRHDDVMEVSEHIGIGTKVLVKQ